MASDAWAQYLADLAQQTRACLNPAWIPCICGDEWYCRIHNMHAAECACPPVEEWTVDPYCEGGPGYQAH